MRPFQDERPARAYAACPAAFLRTFASALPHARSPFAFVITGLTATFSGSSYPPVFASTARFPRRVRAGRCERAQAVSHDGDDQGRNNDFSESRRW